MKRALGIVDGVIGGLAGLLFALALCLSMLGVAGRYVSTRLQLDWIGEVVIFLVIWAILLGAARITRRDAHIRVDAVLHRLPQGWRAAAGFLALGLALVAGAFLVWSGWLVVDEARRWDERSVSTLRVPMWMYYAALPVSLALQLPFLLERIVDLARGRAPSPTHDLTD